MLSAEARIADHEAELASMKAGGSGGAGGRRLCGESNRGMDSDANALTAFKQWQWDMLHNNLFHKYSCPANTQEHAVRNIGKYMNLMQHYYSELFKEVGTNRRLILEACLVLYGFGEGTDSAYKKINAAHTAGAISLGMRDHLQVLCEASNKGVHYRAASFTPEDKLTVANSAFAVAQMVWCDICR